MVVSDLTNQVALEFWGRTDDSAYNVLLVNWFNQVYMNLFMETRWDFELHPVEPLTLIANQQEYNLGSTVDEELSCRVPSTDQEIKYITREELTRRGWDLEATATAPYYFWMSGYDVANDQSKVSFYPIPSGTLVVEFTVTGKAMMLSAGDLVPMPAEFYPCILDGLRVYAAMNDQDLQSAGLYGRIYAAGVTARQRRFTQKPADERQKRIVDVPPFQAPLFRLPPGFGYYGW